MNGLPIILTDLTLKGRLPWLCLLCLLSSCGTLIQPRLESGFENLRLGSYQVDPAHTVVLFKVDHFGLSRFVGRFNDVDATLEFDPDTPQDARLDARVRTASIDVNNAEFEAELTGPDWLNAEAFPEARFMTSRIELVSETEALFHGELTLRGTAAPVVFRAVYNGGGRSLVTGRYTIGFQASATFNRSDYGIDDYIPAIGDEVELEIHAEFQRN